MSYGKINTNNRNSLGGDVCRTNSMDLYRISIPQIQRPKNMKVIIWIEYDQIEPLMKGEMVDYWYREPGMFEKVVQIMVDTDTYQKLKDSRVTNDLKLQHDE